MPLMSVSKSLLLTTRVTHRRRLKASTCLVSCSCMHPPVHTLTIGIETFSESVNKNIEQKSVPGITDGPQDVFSDTVLSAALLGDLSLPLTEDESEAGPEAVQLSMGLGKLTAVCQVVFQSV